jgi:hypothetical protein
VLVGIDVGKDTRSFWRNYRLSVSYLEISIVRSVLQINIAEQIPLTVWEAALVYMLDVVYEDVYLESSQLRCFLNSLCALTSL